MKGFSDKYYLCDGKRSGPWLMFDEGWFIRWQGVYLFLLNWWVTRLWFRWVMRIHRNYPLRTRITGIYPNRTLTSKEVKIRIHDKFSKRTYFAFRYLWWALHYIDQMVNVVRFEPIPGGVFAFDELVAKPAVGLNSPCDGFAYRGGVNQTFSAIKAGTGTVASTASARNPISITASTTENQFTTLIRAIYCFDTSSVEGDILSAVLSLFADSYTSGLGQVGTHIVPATPAAWDILAAADYQNAFTYTSLASKTYAQMGAAGTYKDFTLNDISVINDAGNTGLGLVIAWDFDNAFGGVWASGAQSGFRFYFVDYAGTAADPYLTVTYSTVVNVNITFEDTLTLTDDLRLALKTAVSFIDSLTLTDTLRLGMKLRVVFTDTLSLVDSIRARIKKSAGWIGNIFMNHPERVEAGTASGTKGYYHVVSMTQADREEASTPPTEKQIGNLTVKRADTEEASTPPTEKQIGKITIKRP